MSKEFGNVMDAFNDYIMVRMGLMESQERSKLVIGIQVVPTSILGGILGDKNSWEVEEAILLNHDDTRTIIVHFIPSWQGSVMEIMEKLAKYLNSVSIARAQVDLLNGEKGTLVKGFIDTLISEGKITVQLLEFI